MNIEKVEKQAESEEENGIKKLASDIFKTVYFFVTRSLDLIRAISIRVIFAIHSLVAISLVCFVRNDLWYMVNSVGIVFLGIEWFIIVTNNDGKDLQWFSPSFFIYIATIIPPTWFLELENIRLKTLSLKEADNSKANSTNTTEVAHLNETIYDIDMDSLVPDLLSGDIKSALVESTQNFAMYIEVSMMLTIIIGRWVMPKEGITRSELSQLLLTYMSLASDIIDLLSILQEHKVMISRPMVYCTLSIYSWSLFQFTLNLVSKGNDSNGDDSSSESSKHNSTSSLTANSNKKRSTHNQTMHNELWNVLITLCMQDLPFFILRTVCVFKFDIVSYLFLFFTFKNGILFSLQIYRIIAICTDKDYNYDPNEGNPQASRLVANFIGNAMLPKDLAINLPVTNEPIFYVGNQPDLEQEESGTFLETIKDSNDENLNDQIIPAN